MSQKYSKHITNSFNLLRDPLRWVLLLSSPFWRRINCSIEKVGDLSKITQFEVAEEI